jgi:hypothetical protein
MSADPTSAADCMCAAWDALKRGDRAECQRLRIRGDTMLRFDSDNAVQHDEFTQDINQCLRLMSIMLQQCDDLLLEQIEEERKSRPCDPPAAPDFLRAACEANERGDLVERDRLYTIVADLLDVDHAPWPWDDSELERFNAEINAMTPELEQFLARFEAHRATKQ